MTDTDVKSTPLAAKHVELGARMVPFAGWNMPVQYTGILDEHKAVRETCGIFDISHMGQFTVAGDSAAAWLNSMLTNDINKLNVGQGQYSVMLNDRAGVIDDLILYRMEPETFFVVVNASRIDEDFAWLSAHKPADVTLENHSDEYVGLAVQGPLCGAIFAKVIPGVELPPRNGIARITVDGADLIVCRTGYTGEDGFEFFCPAAEGVKWFEAFLDAGAKPCGLGARDTLRLEAGMALYGNDMDESISPLDAGLAWTVDFSDAARDFVGKAALLAKPSSRQVLGLVLEDKGVLRSHQTVFTAHGEGETTSGTFSPTLEKAIAMARLPLGVAVGDQVEVDIRGKRLKARVVKASFVRKGQALV